MKTGLRAAATSIYISPYVCAMSYRLARRHRPMLGCLPLAALVLGSLTLLIVASVLAVPAVLRKVGRPEQAARWREAAVHSIATPVLLTLLFSAVFLPIDD